MFPTFFYVLVAGALSDRLGRKPLILVPILGSLVEMATYLVGHWCFYSVPLWFFHLSAANEVLKCPEYL